MKVFYETKSDPLCFRVETMLTTLPHLHKEIEIIYVKSGSTIAFADQKAFSLDAGDLYISFPNQIHYYQKCTQGEYYLLILSTDVFFNLSSVLNSNIPESNIIHTESQDPVRTILENISAMDQDYYFTRLNGFVNLLLVELLKKMVLQPEIPTGNPALRSILDYCTYNYTADLSLDNLAEELHLSKYYISHLLNRQLHMSFNDYINNLRIKRACTLLLETDLKIADISEEVGFGTIRSFNRAFKQIMNNTPGKYRGLQ